jgi:hypothetical protein
MQLRDRQARIDLQRIKLVMGIDNSKKESFAVNITFSSILILKEKMIKTINNKAGPYNLIKIITSSPFQVGG